MNQLDAQITASRKRLQNPYAYLDGEGGYSVKLTGTDSRITKSRTLLEDPYAHLDGEGGYSIASPTTHEMLPRINIDEIRNSKNIGKRVSIEHIEEIAKSLQMALWRNRVALFGTEVSDDPISVLNPKVAFEAIGYHFEVSSTLGQFMTRHGLVDCAGFIDKSEMYAGVSSQYPLPVRNFTSAHELGHALLHDAVGMHRDRALDGESIAWTRNREEIEADKFATFFLMPEKLVRAEFKKRFGDEPFIITDNSAFALIRDSQDKLLAECKDLLSLSRKLADASQFAGKLFESISKRFGVSSTAMAIRLMELKLLKL